MNLDEAKQLIKNYADVQVFEKFKTKSLELWRVLGSETLKDAVNCINEHDEEFINKKRELEHKLQEREALENEAKQLEARLKEIYIELKKVRPFPMGHLRASKTLESYVDELNKMNKSEKRKKMKM